MLAYSFELVSLPFHHLLFILHLYHRHHSSRSTKRIFIFCCVVHILFIIIIRLPRLYFNVQFSLFTSRSTCTNVVNCSNVRMSICIVNTLNMNDGRLVAAYVRLCVRKIWLDLEFYSHFSFSGIGRIVSERASMCVYVCLCIRSS